MFERPVFPYVIRSDPHGDGNFGASRDGGARFHDGEDAVVQLGQTIVSPINGFVEKVDYPYATDLAWTGIQIANDFIRAEIWYMEPKLSLLGKWVNIGDYIGKAQAISMKYNTKERVEKYGGYMLDHIHMRLTLPSFSALSKGKWVQPEVRVNPRIFLGG